ncbi:hypothetical protein OK016_11765 [Vibrio chagasii]|nr:hypothetical protein [Vibrio chagasii]
MKERLSLLALSVKARLDYHESEIGSLANSGNSIKVKSSLKDSSILAWAVSREHADIATEVARNISGVEVMVSSILNMVKKRLAVN